ncbi:MAG: ABC transporter ATP-binding protein [Planctomycetota bacterium]
MILQIENLCKQYLHADGPVDALRDVSLEIEEGAFVTITGPSGSGKSTLLLAMGGLLRPTSGTMHFRGKPLHAMSDRSWAAFRREHLGFVMQNFSLIPYLSAIRNVMMPLALKRLGADAQRQRAQAILDSVDLGARANHLPRELSIGQQQRVAIARAFANDPDLILADEPTGNLDPSLSEDILGLLKRLNEESGKTVVMVTHSPAAARLGSVRVQLEHGRIVEARERPAA